MANKKHCDICDAVISNTESAGKVTMTGKLNGQSTDVDMCSAHYNAFIRLYNNFMKFHQGGMVTWPTDTERIMGLDS